MSSRAEAPPVPVNIIGGSLGVGKTTAINHLLTERPPDERWAVLVNEYGEIGVDAALLSDCTKESGIRLREVAGGCICCSAGLMFQVSLVLLLRERPDRLLIEPTGLATISGILETLNTKGIREAVELRSIIALVDPARGGPTDHPPAQQDQIEAADVLLANRCDRATHQDLQAFLGWSRQLFPRKRHVARIERGRIPLDLLDLVSNPDGHSASEPPPRRREPSGGAHPHAHHRASASAPDLSGELVDDPLEPRPPQTIIRKAHQTEEASTVGWVVSNDHVFASDRLETWIQEASKQIGVKRLKAVVRTDTGWWGYNLAEGTKEVRPSSYRRDSRIELVRVDPEPLDPDRLERSLRACLSDAPSTRTASKDPFGRA